MGSAQLRNAAGTKERAREKKKKKKSKVPEEGLCSVRLQRGKQTNQPLREGFDSGGVEKRNTCIT